MNRYLSCYEVKENVWQLSDICDQSVLYQNTNSQDEERRFMRQDELLAKLISSSLSCTLARQMIRYDYGSKLWEHLLKRFDRSSIVFRVEKVYYSLQRKNLLSQSIAIGQGFQVSYDNTLHQYTLSMNGSIALQTSVQPCKLWIFTGSNAFLVGTEESNDQSSLKMMVNYSLSDGVVDLQCWHERLGHICPQFVKQMADQNLVYGMMLTKRRFDLCEACQVGKQRGKPPHKNLSKQVAGQVTVNERILFKDRHQS
ncbi:hypothetical protein PHMEG_00031383 [Phytophthora megakarya]|uniref:GAG-pre-integrase domain-containing protein n=1 Tax=Phytophthora megakarya TaxID=4795 RepID=A0A225UYR5_9STRA|nr:hypothetical protein PHMEG_00031383 [Phytophthora megakarya]